MLFIIIITFILIIFALFYFLKLRNTNIIYTLNPIVQNTERYNFRLTNSPANIITLPSLNEKYFIFYPREILLNTRPDYENVFKLIKSDIVMPKIEFSSFTLNSDSYFINNSTNSSYYLAIDNLQKLYWSDSEIISNRVICQSVSDSKSFVITIADVSKTYLCSSNSQYGIGLQFLTETQYQNLNRIPELITLMKLWP